MKNVSYWKIPLKKKTLCPNDKTSLTIISKTFLIQIRLLRNNVYMTYIVIFLIYMLFYHMQHWNQAAWTLKQFDGLSQNPVSQKHRFKVTFTGFVHNVALQCVVNNSQSAGIIDMDGYQNL